MSFTVQTDGGVIYGANSYVDVAFFRSYLADRGIATSQWLEAAVQAALVEVTDFEDNVYEWIGYPTTDLDDRLRWPRFSAVMGHGNPTLRYGVLIPENKIPLSLKRGTSLYAYARLSSGKEVNLSILDQSKAVVRKKVGDIDKTFAEPLAQLRYPAAERQLAGLWVPDTPGAARLSR